MSFFLCYRTLLYNSEIYNGTVLHSQPMFMGMDSSKQYYGIYLDTRGAPVQLEVMPGYEKKNWLNIMAALFYSNILQSVKIKRVFFFA